MVSAAQRLATLTVRQKIGQLIMTSVGHHSGLMVNAPEAPDAGFWAEHEAAMRLDRVRAAEEIQRYALGGVCYFPGRLDGSSPAEVADTVAALQAVAGVPLIVATDQEGGAVARLRRGFTVFGSARAMAATGDPAAVAEAAHVSGRELRSVGINQVYAPVCDLNTNPANPVIGTRSYGSDPLAAAPYLTAVIEGYARAGVASTAKHFPGHGDTTVDSHRAVPVLTGDLEGWWAGEGTAFALAVAAGVDAVMTGHLSWPAVDPAPATYSAAVLGLLRNRLGFDGVVVSDALDMGGATGDPVDAVLAGVDQLLMPVDVAATVDALAAAVESGRLPEARLDEACGRVWRLKERLGLLDPAAVPVLGAEPVGQHVEQAVALAARAVTRHGPAFDAVIGPVAVRGEGPARGRLEAALTGAGIAVTDDAARVIRVDDLTAGADRDLLVITAMPPARLPAGRTVLLTWGDDGTALAGLVRVLQNPPAG